MHEDLRKRLPGSAIASCHCFEVAQPANHTARQPQPSGCLQSSSCRSFQWRWSGWSVGRSVGWFGSDQHPSFPVKGSGNCFKSSKFQSDMSHRRISSKCFIFPGESFCSTSEGSVFESPSQRTDLIRRKQLVCSRRRGEKGGGVGGWGAVTVAGNPPSRQ